MRARSVRLTIVILLILGLAVAALAVRPINIDLPGFPALDREGTGPLGLKLGLDLSGGGHLVYQADTGSRFDVTLLEPADLEAISAALNGFRFGDEELPLEDYQVFPREVSEVQREVPPDPIVEETDPTKVEDGEPGEGEGEQEAPPEPEFVRVLVTSIFQIRTPLLAQDDPRRTGLRDAIEDSLGQISLFQVVDIREPTVDQMEGVLDNITRRVNRFGTEEPIIQIFGDDRIIVQLPGASGSTTDLIFADPVDSAGQAVLSDALSGAGYRDVRVERVEERSFRVLSGTVNSETESAARVAVAEAVGPVESFSVISAIDEAKGLIGETALLEFKERTCGSLDPFTSACLDPTDADLGLTGEDLDGAEAAADPVGVGWVVNLQFDGRGSDIFSGLTRRIAGVETKRIAVFMDDREIIAPVSRAWIRDGNTQISGDFTREEARTLSIQLESGRLQVPLKLIQESDTGPILGAESLRNSLRAGLVGLGLVLIFMIAYYRLAGVVAAFALVFYAVMVLAVFKLIPITLELAHIGGFILSVGMAVDANILIFERMKEEVRIGRTLASSMEVGFSRAWPAIRDSNISTMITCLVLLWFGDRLGGGLVTGVAISLFIGVAASMFTAVVVSRNLLQLLAFAGMGQRINLFTPESTSRATQSAGGNR